MKRYNKNIKRLSTIKKHVRYFTVRKHVRHS